MSKETEPGKPAQPDRSGKPARPEAPETPAHRPEAGEIAKRKEIGGAEGPEPTRYGDWEHKGRVSDF